MAPTGTSKEGSALRFPSSLHSYPIHNTRQPPGPGPEGGIADREVGKESTVPPKSPEPGREGWGQLNK